MEQNREPVADIFAMLARDFPERTIVVEGEEIATAEALQVDDNPTLSTTAHEWLAVHAVGRQHGYDRPTDREEKIFIDEADVFRYKRALGVVRLCGHSLVDGGTAPISTANANILVGGGFPHLNARRLYDAIDGDYDRLWEVNTTTIITGQRRRWNDNANEDTTNKVINRLTRFTGLNLETDEGRMAIGGWLQVSKFVHEQEELRGKEGTPWEQPFATEAEMARGALELALWRAPGLFDWREYPVIAHEDPNPQPIDIDGFHVPARTVRAWEYQLNNGRLAFVTNGVAVARDKGGEPRATSISATQEATAFVGNQLRSHESIVSFGAPHVRASVSTAGQIIAMTNGEAKPVHITTGPWEFHEPVVTGIASIAGSDMVDKQIRDVLRRVG